MENTEHSQLKSFKDLLVWQKSADLGVSVYRITSTFPSSELYGMTNQMRRAAVSISSNIAEGFKRQHRREKEQFYYIAYGSAAELESQVEIAYKLGFFSEKEYKALLSLVVEVSKMISGLVKSLNSKSSILNSVHGFTVVELLVSIGIFSVVMSIAMGGFTQALRSQRQAAAFIAANSNMSLALEQMVREMRVGQDFDDTVLCPSGSSGLSFQRIIRGGAASVVYCLDETAKTIMRGEGSDPGQAIAAARPIVADNVYVKRLDFTLFGDSNYPPRITITVGVGAKETTLRAFTTNIQATISARR